MSEDEKKIAAEANAIITTTLSGCEERFGPNGEQLKTRHVYRGGSDRCECGSGPDLSRERMR